MEFKKFFKTNLTVSLILVLSFFIIVNNFFRFFQNNNVYEFDPWLSNYQGGFVRRGLPGEFFYQIHEIFNIHLGWIAFIFVLILYFLFYFCFFHLIKNIKLNKILIFSIFSPISFYFPILNSKATGQKEIIFLCLLTIYCYLIPKIKKNYAVYISVFIILFSGLSHEGLLFYVAYLIIPFLFFYNFKNLKEVCFHLLPIFLVTLLLLFLTYNFHGTEQQVSDICDSLKTYAHTECKNIGQIAALGFISNLDWNVAFKETIGRYKGTYGLPLFPKYFLIYGIGFVLGFMPLFIIFFKTKLLRNPFNLFEINPLWVLFAPLVFTIPIYYAGFDWGRYLYISYVSTLIIMFFCLRNNIFYINKEKIIKKDNIIIKFIFIIAIIIYGFGWTVPICCELNFKPGISKVVERAVYYYNRDY